MEATIPKTGTALQGLDSESRQMVIETVRQLKKRLLIKDKILEFDKKEIFPDGWRCSRLLCGDF